MVNYFEITTNYKYKLLCIMVAINTFFYKLFANIHDIFNFAYIHVCPHYRINVPL